ncbi:conserved hypothetical protein [Leishmania mexicana MHOM/GT/2001/U1103]|uniref:Uncharacterized protein n=1 Tax=Leishmania mexicana (strain MHOM/GT/2001/U1103) TaxID=929439 RepID=E9AWZ3_LEIMU|nr:conserved hypothetical protein [Leishmania mexicana MHOM/GT/2001/U1103]CBZ27479.1 conserved hypothetical protein [Leishmania mexicana MHOM/GT/2001/U1103]
MNESSSLQRTARARAHAAQYFMEIDNACMPLLPDDPEKRISLHRQLRGRYNPTQIPLSSLSCAAYLGASDVAQLAALFRQYNLFSSEMINTLHRDDIGGGGSGTSSAEGRGKAAVAAAATATTAKAPKSRPRSAGRDGEATPQSPSMVRPTVGTAPRPPVVLDAMHGKTGMGVLRCDARPQHPSALPSVRPSSASPRAAGVLAAAAGAAVTPSLSTLPSVRRAEGEPVAPTLAEMAVGDRRELAEPFTRESNDAALTTGWLVELLLEMVIENSAQSVNASVGGGGASPAAAGVASGQPPMPPVGSLSQPRPGTGSHHPYSNANATHVGLACLNSVTMLCQTRRRDVRVDQLRHFKAELTDWAERLAQRCDEGEHRAAWHQCVAQEEVLQRYQACVLQSQVPRLMGASLTGAPGGTGGALSSRPKMLSFVNFEPAGTVVSNRVGSNASPRRNGGAGGRSNVSWGPPHVVQVVSPDAAPTSTSRGTLCPSPLGSAARLIAPSWDPQSKALPAAVRQQAEVSSSTHSDTSDADEVLSMHDSDTGCGLVHPSFPVGMLHSTTSSLAGSMVILPSNTTGPGASVVPSSMNVSVSGVSGAAADRSLLAAKARLTAPGLKDLLQQPAQLYAYLWTSSVAARLVEEEERHQHHQRVRMVHGSQPQPSRGGEKSPSGSSMGPTESAFGARRSRAAAVQHLVCWSDVASNLLIGLEATWLSQRHEAAYARVPTAVLEDLSEMTAPKRGGSGRHIGAGSDAHTVPRSFTSTHEDGSDDDSDSLDDGVALGGGTSSVAGVAGSGQACRRRLHKIGLGNDAVALQQRAVLFNSLGAAAEATLGALHSEAADHILASPTWRYTVTSSKDGLLKVWDTTSGQFVSTILNIGQSWVLTMTFLHGGEFLMVATSAAEITVVNFPAGGVLLKLRGCTSLATAVPQVKQPSTFFTKRYGLKPGECGRHKPTCSDGGGWLGAAAAARIMEYAEGESEPIVARPIVGYVTPTAAFFDAEMGFFFFGTMSGMVGCVDLTAVLSRTALHAAAAGAGWAYPLEVYGSVLAHPEVLPPEIGAASTPASEMPLPSLDSNVTYSRLSAVGHRKTRTVSPYSLAAAGMTAVTSSGGLPVNRLFFCGVGHCIISSDPDGGIVRTSFAAAADTLDYALGSPTVVMATAKPIRFMVSCASGRRFVTVHSDRRAFLWAVGRTLTECVHQYPQEAYDIIDVCFMPPHQQVAILMSDHSIRIYDERGSRPLTSILPPRGLSSRVEDMASMTLKCSANDVDGCLTYLPTTQRLVCGLRGPVLYEPAARGPARGGASISTVKGLEMPAATDATEGMNSNPADAAPASSTEGMQVEEAPLPPSSSPSLGSSLSLPPLTQSALPFSTPTSTALAATQKVTTLSPQRSHIASVTASVGSSTCGGMRGLGGETVSTETEKAKAAAAAAQEVRRQRQLHAALHKCHQRLRPHQTHSSAVIGLLLDPGRGELHSFSTDTWCVWYYETGKRFRAPLHVPRAAEKELAVRSRRALLTCCSWSTEGRTRVLVGTRDSRVLTLDARLGSVMSTTDPFTQSTRGPTSGASSPTLLADKDVGAISSTGCRTLLCSGHVCEVRRYEVTSAPKPSGEENFISMRVELPSAAAAVAPSPTHGGGTVTTVAPAATAAKDTKCTTSATRGGCSDTTITACCVVRESHLCLGTADTQLFFYRMVDRSSPLHVEVLCDAHGLPDVGRVVSLNYLNDLAHDMLLAVVDTGILFLYSYALQRTLGRHTFSPLGPQVFLTASPNFTPRAHTRGPQQQEHYITSVSFAREVVGVPQSSLLMACGDSAGYVHVVPLAHLLAEVLSATSRDKGASSAARVAKSHELRVSASFRASRGGVSSLELLATNPSKPTVATPSHASMELPSTARITAATSVATPSTVPFSEPHLLVFAAGFDGNVRVFSLSPNALQQDLLPLPHFAIATYTSAWSAATTSLQLPQSVAAASNNCTKVSHNRTGVSSLPGRSSSFRTFGGGRASLPNHALGAMCYEVSTVGLCGVDTWDLCDPRTFSDTEQATVITQAYKDGHIEVVLPSILDGVDDTEGNADECGVAENAVSAPGERIAAVGVPSARAKKESGAVLLYDILRRSKKQKPGSPTTAVGTNAQQPLLQPRLAATATGAAADGAAPRQCGSAPRSRSSPPPSSTRIATPAATAAVADPRAAAAWSGKVDAGTNDGSAHHPGCCASAAPPLPPLPPPPPAHFMPHAIGELVRNPLPHSWSCSSSMRDVAAASFALLDPPMHDATGCVRDGYIHGVLSPIPQAKAMRNPLVRVYPLALLRQMGLLHPLDTTPDVDPKTGLLVLISAHDAFKPWKTRVLGTESASASTAAPNLMATSPMTSVKSVHPAPATVEVGPPPSAAETNGTDAALNVHKCAYTSSSSYSFSEASGSLCPRRTTVTAWPTPLSLTPDYTRSAGAEVEAGWRHSSPGVDDTEPETSVFLTEGGVDWTRRRLHTTTPASFTCFPVRALGTAAVAREPGSASRRTITEEEKTAVAGPDGSQRVTICAPSTTEWKIVSDAVRDSGEASSQRSISSANPSSALAWSNRSRPPLFLPVPPTSAQSLARQKMTYLRGSLGGLDAEVLRMREDQMMLAHMAAQLDCSRQVPLPACRNATAAVDGTGTHSSPMGTPLLGEYTSRLIRLWRQRAGDAVVEAVTAALKALGAEEAAEPHGSATAAEDTGTNTSAGAAATSAMSHTAAARAREPKLGSGSLRTRGLRVGDKRVPGKAMLSPRQRDPTVMVSSSRSERRSSHGGQSNPQTAYASLLQASKSTTFGLELLALSLPNEPQGAPTRARRRTDRGADASLSAGAAAAPSRRGARAPVSAAAATAASSKAAPHLEARFPMIAVQQEVQPIRVCLPSTLRADEGERMWLRRFEAAFNSVDK